MKLGGLVEKDLLNMMKIFLKLRILIFLFGVGAVFMVFPNKIVFSQDTKGFNVYLPLIQKSNVFSDDFFVTIDGSENGDGSWNNPWDLDSALLGHSEVKPGDIIWVIGGIYHPVVEPSKYNIKVSGTEDNPVVVRAYPGERVSIDGGIQIHNPNVVFWGFEVFSSSTLRTSDDRPGGIAIYSDNVALINNVIHDGEFGISAQVSTGSYYSRNALIYGNLSYNNGYIEPDRGHGHGLYAQNQDGTKHIYENIIFNNFGGYSFHIYGEDVPLNNFVFFGNVAINDNFLVGGLKPATNIQFYENYTFNAKTKFGFSDVDNVNISAEGNHFWNDASSALDIKWWDKDVNILNNFFYSKDTLSLLESNKRENYTWDQNSYYSYSTNLYPFNLNKSTKNWSEWRNSTGFDLKSNFFPNIPTKTNVIVRPNDYEEKRGNIIIQNWQKLASVNVDISTLGLEIGDEYTIHNALNFYDETIEGTYNGKPITIPMIGWTVAIPIGWYEPLGENTFPSFGTFVLITKP